LQRVLSNRRFHRALECLLDRIGQSLYTITLAHPQFRVLFTEDVCRLLVVYAPNLRRLNLQGCLVHVQALQHLHDMYLLHHVNMEGTQLLDATTHQPPTDDAALLTNQLTSAFDGVRSLAQFVMGPAGEYLLPVLTLNVHNTHTCSAHMPRLGSAHLEHVHLTNITSLDDTLLTHLCDRSPNITALALCQCMRVQRFACIKQLHNLTQLLLNNTNVRPCR